MATYRFLSSDGGEIALESEAVASLAESLRGDLILPEDARYDEARAVWNGMIDHRPGAIAACAGTADVIQAVNFARENHLLLSVRGGGHNAAGNAVADGGLVIDLAQMNSVLVDSSSRIVRAGGGTTIGVLDHETQAVGLAVPQGVVTETGIAGLTLGGGLGWLRRKYGLSCDNLIGADVVTAEGNLVHCSERDNADLLWGLRGGGGNFGVVTTFELRAYPVGPEVFFAFVIHPWEGAREALQFYRGWAAAAPDEISSFAILWHAPAIDDIPAEAHDKPIVVFLAMYSGTPEEGERALQSLRDHGSPVVDFSDTMLYVDVQQFFDEDYPSGEMHYYWKSAYLSGLSDKAIDLLMARNVATPSHHSTIDLWQMGGALSRIAADETAFGDRSAPFLMGIEANWEPEGDDEANIAWARDIYSALQPYATGGEYMNFPGLYEDTPGMVKASFGGNHERLVALKQKYDPQNLFRLNQNIDPQG